MFRQMVRDRQAASEAAATTGAQDVPAVTEGLTAPLPRERRPTQPGRSAHRSAGRSSRRAARRSSRRRPGEAASRASHAGPTGMRRLTPSDINAVNILLMMRGSGSGGPAGRDVTVGARLLQDLSSNVRSRVPAEATPSRAATIRATAAAVEALASIAMQRPMAMTVRSMRVVADRVDLTTRRRDANRSFAARLGRAVLANMINRSYVCELYKGDLSSLSGSIKVADFGCEFRRPSSSSNNNSSSGGARGNLCHEFCVLAGVAPPNRGSGTVGGETTTPEEAVSVKHKGRNDVDINMKQDESRGGGEAERNDDGGDGGKF